jgi:tetratricopeptide (TPR) repeat protein
MNKHKELTRESAEAEAASASQALGGGDWEAALQALAFALQFDPFREKWTSLLDRALDAGGSNAAAYLKQSGHQPYLGFEALKAYAAHRAGDYASAFNELEILTRNYPHVYFAEAWGFDWLTEEAIRGAGENAFRFLAAAIHNRYPEADEVNDWGRAQLSRAVAALERIEKVQGGSNDLTVLFKGQMLSKSGRFDEAVQLAERAAEINPTFRTATAAAMANKRAGNVEGAVGWFWRASELDPKNETGLLDIGDTYAGLSQWDKALAAYEAALKRVANHDWAYPSAVYCRYRISGDPALLEELRYMANAGPDECGMADLMKQMFGGYNFEDRRRRAEALMREVEPDFEPNPRPHEHDEEGEESYDEGGGEEAEEGKR